MGPPGLARWGRCSAGKASTSWRLTLGTVSAGGTPGVVRRQGRRATDPLQAEVAPAEEPSGSARGSNIVATLLDEGCYLCSARTMYPLLGAHGEPRCLRPLTRPPPGAVR